MRAFDTLSPMKISISKSNVAHLVQMLDDFYHMDVGYEDSLKIWGDFDCIGIIDDLTRAERECSEDGVMDVNADTVFWLSVILDNMLTDANKGQPPLWRLSAVTQCALMDAQA